jgi:biotin carboxylase
VTAPLRKVSAAAWPFQTMLVANRGEIAVRILRSVQELGLEAAVVFHAADAAYLGGGHSVDYRAVKHYRRRRRWLARLFESSCTLI